MMKKCFFSVVTFLFLCMNLIFVSCSGNSKSNSDVRFVFPPEAIQQIVSRAANPNDPCTLTVTLYVDSWVQEEKTEELTLNGLGGKGKSFVFKDVLVGTNVVIKAVVICGEDSYTGWSNTVELTVDGAELSVTLKKDFRTLVSDDSVLQVKDYQLPAPVEKIDVIGNQYWELNASGLSVSPNCKYNWYIDERYQDETAPVYKVYKRLLGNGVHTVSLIAIDGNVKYTAETQIAIYNDFERVAFVSTDRGLEFRINFDPEHDECLEYPRLTENTSGIIMHIEGAYEKYGWSGCWPFVEPGQTYNFTLDGSRGHEYYYDDQNDPNHEHELVRDLGGFEESERYYSVTYEGTKNTPLSKRDMECIITMQNYSRNNAYEAKEVKVGGTDAEPEVHVLLNYEQTNNEVYDLFKDTGEQIIRVWMDTQFLYTEDVTDDQGQYLYKNEKWFVGTGIIMKESGYTFSNTKNFDIYDRFNEDERAKFNYVVNRNNDLPDWLSWYPTDFKKLNYNDDYELRLNFLYSLKDFRYVYYRIECTNDNNNHRNVNVKRVGSN